MNVGLLPLSLKSRLVTVNFTDVCLALMFFSILVKSYISYISVVYYTVWQEHLTHIQAILFYVGSNT